MLEGEECLTKDYFVSEMGILKPKRVIENGKVTKYEKVHVLDVAGGTGDIAFRILEKQKKLNADIDHLKVERRSPRSQCTT
jgi:ubiquinone/menaquinone biosynthesis C-methylase UbiE